MSMRSDTRAELDKAWRRRCALFLLAQRRLDIVRAFKDELSDLPASVALEAQVAAAMKATAERRWLRAVLAHAGDTNIRKTWDAALTDYVYELGDGARFTPVRFFEEP